jgi:hypothetical protein
VCTPFLPRFGVLEQFASVTASQISLGRGFRHTVNMFFSARDLVEENDRRLDAMAADEEIESTAEYIPLKS